MPVGVETPLPLMFLAGYELDFAACSEYFERGWAVANPVTPEIPESWAWDNQLARSINLDVALLHMARAQPFVDDARVMRR